jgi:predicted dehydrogenase/nucleoside-diphosphate-sugar epimerase
MNPFRFLILGGGAIVRDYHLPALDALGWIDRATVVEPWEENARRIKKAFPSAKILTAPYQEVLANREAIDACDGVLVALPNSLHFDASLRSLQAGRPVLCEKPLALTARECLELDQAARRLGMLLAVGMVRRFTPSLTALRDGLRADLIGEPVRIALEQGGDCRHWSWDTETVLRRDQGGCLVNMGIHFLDFLEWIFGRLEPVSYQDDFAGGVEMNCDLSLRTQGGVPVRVRVSWTHRLKNELRVDGTKGALVMRLEDVSGTQWQALDGSVTAELTAERPFVSGDWQATFSSCFAEQFWQFAAEARGTAPRPRLVQAREAAHSHELIEWAYAERTPRAAAVSRRPELPSRAVAVTGGTGFVGSHLVERLAELGMTSIVVPVRHFRTGSQIARFPMEMKRTNLLDQASCQAAFRGARHVFHLAYDSAGDFTVQSTRTVLQAALAEGVESVVVFGTCTVWAGHEGTEVDEATPPLPGLGEYGASKARMQAECLAFAKQHPEMRVSVVAPGAVYGPRGGLFCATPAAAAKEGTFAWFDGGRGICNYVHVANLIDLAILAATKPEAAGECFIGVDGQTDWRRFLGPLVEPWKETIGDLTLADVQALRQQKGRKTGWKDVARAALASPALMSALSGHPMLGPAKNWFTGAFPDRHRQLQSLRVMREHIRKPQPPARGVTTWMADIYGAGTVRFSSRKARQVLGWEPVVGLEQGMAGCVAWLEDTGVHPGRAMKQQPGERQETIAALEAK